MRNPIVSFLFVYQINRHQKREEKEIFFFFLFKTDLCQNCSSFGGKRLTLTEFGKTQWKGNVRSCVIKRKKSCWDIGVRIPFDGQHNRDNQNGFIRFTTFCPWFGKRHEFFPVASKRKNGIFSTKERERKRENSTYAKKMKKIPRAFLWLSIGPLFVSALCLPLSLFLSLSLPLSHTRTDDPINKRKSTSSLLYDWKKLFYYSVTHLIFLNAAKLKGLFQCVPLYSYRYYR